MRTDQRPIGYVICCEPRSGSSFLGRILASTGCLGRPKEYFGYAKVRAEVLRDPEAGMRTLLERAATPNGVYGLKMFSYHFDVMARSGWADRLPNLRYIHLERRDLLDQAISYVRGMQTGRFQSHQPSLRRARYDGRAIARQLNRLALDQARWRRYFARNSIQALPLVYEDVAADPQAAAIAVAALVGIPPPRIVEAAIDLEVMRDGLSAEWRRRFVAERGDRSRLVTDGLVWPARQWLRRIRQRLDLGAVKRDPRDWP